MLDEPLGDVESGAGIFDFVDNEDVFAVETRGSLENSVDVFASDAARDVERTNAGKIGGRDVFSVEVTERLATRGAIGRFEIAVRINGGATTAEPGLAVDVEIRMGGALLVGEIGPESIDEPADGAGGFVEINDMVRFFEFGRIFVFGRSAVEGGDEVGSVGNVVTESFVDVPVVASVVPPARVELVLFLENWVFCGVDTEAVGGKRTLGSLGILEAFRCFGALGALRALGARGIFGVKIKFFWHICF